MNLKSYLITDPKYYTSNSIEFANQLHKAFLNHKIDFACFRDKISTNKKQLAKIFIDICKQNSIENFLINTDIELAIQLKAYGVHLNSKQFDKISLAKQNNLFTIISCHNEKEIEVAIKNNADAITYSPIFTTPNKGEPKGVKKLLETVNRFDIPIFALGGIINKEQINKIEKTNCYGFSSIRYFISNNLV